jgi:hypothetical protein
MVTTTTRDLYLETLQRLMITLSRANDNMHLYKKCPNPLSNLCFG